MRAKAFPAMTVLLACVVLSLVAAAPVPRKSPGLTIVAPAGEQTQQTQLSSFKGKVVVVEFLLTHCPHCWRLARTVDKLHQELGPRGLETLGVAFDKDITGRVLADFVKRSRVGFPVGFTTSDKVDSFLGREGAERFQVPQIVVIDRAGAIRAQSRPTAEPNLEREDYLRNLIDGLLKEAPPA